jgi:hypothetical protein
MDKIVRRIYTALCWMLFLCIAQIAYAQTVVTVVNNGNPDNRVDIAILAEGYTSSEMSKFASDVNTITNNIFSQEPYLEYQRYFNIHRVEVASNESGADHPERNPAVYKNTAFDAYYNCSGIQRLICANTSKALTAASNALLPSQRDIIVVLVNDSEYGGSGGSIAVASTNFSVVELVLHETAHSFGLLGDEYGGPPPPQCTLASEPSQPNVTMQSVRSLIKWNAWIDPSTPIPTYLNISYLPGLYEGAQYCDYGKYRPTYGSKMRFLNAPFEQINAEQLIKRIYNWVSPIDSSSPAETSLTITQGIIQPFSVTTPLPLTHNLDVRWYVDSQLKGSASSFSLDSSELSAGLHTVEAVIEDNTAAVRNDPAEALRERRSWNVTVNEIPSLFQLAVLKSGSGSVTSFPSGISCGGACTASYAAGAGVTLTGTADPGSYFTGWSAPCSGNQACTISITADTQITATFNPAGYPFLDVIPGNWAESYINAIYNVRITTGYGGANEYKPDYQVSRDQMAAFIIRAKEGEPPATYCDSGCYFTDVALTGWACKYIKRLYELNITTGYGGTNQYRPELTVTRDQMAAFIIRAKEGEPPANYCDSGSPFTDVPTSHWACKYIKRLYLLGITTGYGGSSQYRPELPVTRAQMAAFVGRAFLGMQ